MPIPQPRANEEEQAFVSRFMADEAMRRDYPDEKQRAAVAYNTFRDSKKAEEAPAPSGAVTPEQIKQDLAQSMAEEIAARDVYLERGRRANTDLYQHIAGEESAHFIEFKKRLEGAPVISSIDLKVRYVGKDVLLDFIGMNPAVAHILGFPDIAEDECLVLEGMSAVKTEETIQHERAENDMVNWGIAYWQAHKMLMKKEDETMKFKDARKMAVKFVDEEAGIIEGIAAPFGGPFGGKDLQGTFR